ncbi:MAG: hypothetical protein M1815_006325 [Lichina confinis]|nr:MAG: hypothetical protein M1815_006325 [Lichina confinis]
MADPELVRKFGIASGALTVIGFFGNFCHTLVKACFGGSEPSILGVSVGPNNSGVVIGGNAGGNAASPAELESLLREARKSLESRRKDEHRSSREGEAHRKGSATANKANTAD